MNKNYSEFPSKNEILNYLNEYIALKNLNKNVIYNANVETVKYFNKWVVTTNNSMFTSKYLCICSGYYNYKNIPNDLYNNLKYFTGNIYHSKELYRYNLKEEFTNKNVVIIGNGASACDILIHINKFVNTLYVLYRKDKFYFNKYLGNIPLSNFLNKYTLYILEKLNIYIFLLLNLYI